MPQAVDERRAGDNTDAEIKADHKTIRISAAIGHLSWELRSAKKDLKEYQS